MLAMRAPCFDSSMYGTFSKPGNVMSHSKLKFACVASLCLFAAASHAGDTPAGLWKTIDDHTGKETSFVRIVEAHGVYAGIVERIVDPAKQDSHCELCTDERKDAPVLGMTIVRNVRHNQNDAAVWDGGDILDPKNGKVYRVRLKPVEGGQKLEVRGYIGISLLGRTQIWQRVE